MLILNLKEPVVDWILTPILFKINSRYQVFLNSIFYRTASVLKQTIEKTFSRQTIV